MPDQKVFKELLSMLGEIHNKEITPTLARIYWEALKPYSVQQVQDALNQSVLTSRFMPKPVDLIELIEGDFNEQAAQEWGKMLSFMRKQGRFGESKLPDNIKKTVDQLGGWPHLCTLSQSQLDFKSKEFNKIFESKSKRGLIANDQRRLRND